MPQAFKSMGQSNMLAILGYKNGQLGSVVADTSSQSPKWKGKESENRPGQEGRKKGRKKERAKNFVGNL